MASGRGGRRNRFGAIRIFALIVLASLALGCRQAPPPDTTAQYWPTDKWREQPPESEGFSSAALAAMLGEIRKKGPAIHSLLVIRHGNVILDANFYPFIAGTRHDIASVTKSVTSLLVGAAIFQGKLETPDQRIFDLIGERPLQPDPRKGRITLGDLLAMRSGFDCGFHGEAELDAMRATSNWIQAAVNFPMRDEPRTRMAYCSPNYHVVSKALQNITGMPMAQFAQRSLFSRLGIADYFWPADAAGVTHGWGDLQLTTRDLAKIGYLLVHDGVWDGTRVLPAGWIARTSKPISKYNASDSYGMGWWTHPSAPPGMYEAIGRGGQRLTIWPAKDLIVVFTGGGFEPGDIGTLLLAAYKADTAIAHDPAGADQLRLGLTLAALAPAAAAVSSSPPEAARRAAGRAFDFPANDFQLRSLTFFFDPGRERVHMELGDRTLDLPIGFDGQYRIANDSIDGIPPGTRGMFRGDNELVLDLNLIGKINRYEFDIRFLDDEMSVGMVEVTGTFRTTVVGRRRH